MPNDVTLRGVTPDDLPILYEHQHDAESSAMAAVPSREWDAYLAHWTRILADPTTDKQTILYGGQVVGNLVAFDRDGQREVGYWLDKATWGKGIATRALALFLRQLPTRPLHAIVAAHNPASLRVLQKNGFTLTGETREADDAGGEPLTIYHLRLDEETAPPHNG
jgi:RimJ/RimL family protein N-acetyltransferase